MLKSDQHVQRAEVLGSLEPSGERGPASPQLASEGGRRLPSADRNLTVTPLDMRQAKFGTGFRGLNRTEVTAFLLEAAEGYEQALRENDRLRQEVGRLESALTQYRDLEGSLKSTLMTAQKTADDVRENAAQEAGRIVREAEGRAELLMERSQSRMDEVQRDIDTLRMKRREAEANLESLVAAIRNTITFIHEQEQRDLPKAVGAHHLQVVR